MSCSTKFVVYYSHIVRCAIGSNIVHNYTVSYFLRSAIVAKLINKQLTTQFYVSISHPWKAMACLNHVQANLSWVATALASSSLLLWLI